MLFNTIKKTSTFIAISVFLASIASLSSVLLISKHANAAELVVNVNKIDTIKGHIMLAMYDNKASYNNGKPSQVARVKVSKAQQEITFKDLPEGEYAIKLFQDTNDNNKMDVNILGLPLENYGFSNNVGRFGQPDYKKAKFAVKAKTTINIALF